MNHRLNKLVATIIIAAMLLPITALAIDPTESHAADAFWIEPSTLSYSTDTTPTGTTFTVTVFTNTSGPTYTWQVKMYWNTAHLNLSDIGYTGVGKSEFFDGHGTVPVVPAIDYLAGSVVHGESLVGTDQKEADVGSLFWAEFEIIGAPGKGGVYNSQLDIDNIDTYWLDPNLDEVTTSKINADYTYTWATPPSPNFAIVNPATMDQEFYFDEYKNWTDPANSDFDAEVYLEDVNAAWYVHNASLSIAYNSTVLSVVGVVVDPQWTGPNVVGIVPGTISIVVRNPIPAPPSGDVLIATITFRILLQGEVPDPDIVETLDIYDGEVWDTTLLIPLNPEKDGDVTIKAFLTMVMPYLEVSDVTMGPEPCLGELFNVTVTLKNLNWHWYLIGIEFRLAYDPFFMTPEATHILGPYLPSYAGYHNALGYPGCFWQTYNEPGPPDGDHVLAGQMIYPNASGWWNTNETLGEAWPGGPEVPGEGVIAILQFRVNYQSFGEPNMTSPLEIIDQLAIGITHPDQDIVGIPMDEPVNGLYTITTHLPGRVIDVYGGALNRGYGSHPFPAPYGGQGPNNPMDLVIPQAEVCLCANVTYNYWPVQNKLVGFEVEDPYGGILLKRTATTDYYGVACICFEMPWPCDEPERLIGVWTVTVTVDISDFRINDTLEFHYDYLVNIAKVTTDKYEYNHCEWVEITITYETHAQQWYPLLLSALIMDELLVPVGIGFITTEVGGAEYCSYTNFTDTICIHIPKWAFAGIATIHVNAYDRDPTEGGVAWAPEFTPPPIIAIQPY